MSSTCDSLRRRISETEGEIQKVKIGPLEFVTYDERRERSRTRERLGRELKALNERYDSAIKRGGC